MKCSLNTIITVKNEFIDHFSKYLNSYYLNIVPILIETLYRFLTMN